MRTMVEKKPAEKYNSKPSGPGRTAPKVETTVTPTRTPDAAELWL